MQNKESLLTALGYEVLSCTDGVYRLKAKDNAHQFVGVLRAEPPLDSPLTSISLVLTFIEPGMPVDRIQEHWRNLDVRRIAGSEITVVPIRVPKELTQAPTQAESFVRPAGAGLRYAQRLSNGDVVCSN